MIRLTLENAKKNKKKKEKVVTVRMNEEYYNQISQFSDEYSKLHYLLTISSMAESTIEQENLPSR